MLSEVSSVSIVQGLDEIVEDSVLEGAIGSVASSYVGSLSASSFSLHTPVSSILS